MVDYHPTHEPVRSEESTADNLQTECRWCGIEGDRPEVANPCPYEGPREFTEPPAEEPDRTNAFFVGQLRALSDFLADPDNAGHFPDLVFFPPARRGETQPTPLIDYVPRGELAGLLHYIADMVEE